MKPHDEAYTPGHSERSRTFMAKRAAESHGAFFLPFLTPGMRVLDCGCGPGTITRGLAEAVAEGTVTGIDFSAEQIAEAQSLHAGIPHLSFQAGSIYTLPFEDTSFDAVFAHALFEHLARPADALREIYRVLKPGGLVGLCSPDFAAFVIAPETESSRAAFQFYREMQESNGGDTLAGRKLPSWLTEAEFEILKTAGRCENYADPAMIGEYLAEQLDPVAPEHAQAFRDWQNRPGALFAQMWISAIGRKA